MSYFGANVLHPRTTLPAMKYNIPITIRNFFRLDAPGMLASKAWGVAAHASFCAKFLCVRGQNQVHERGCRPASSCSSLPHCALPPWHTGVEHMGTHPWNAAQGAGVSLPSRMLQLGVHIQNVEEVHSKAEGICWSVISMEKKGSQVAGAWCAQPQESTILEAVPRASAVILPLHASNRTVKWAHCSMGPCILCSACAVPQQHAHLNLN